MDLWRKVLLLRRLTVMDLVTDCQPSRYEPFTTRQFNIKKPRTIFLGQDESHEQGLCLWHEGSRGH